MKINAAKRLEAARGVGTLSLKVGSKSVSIKTDNFAEHHDGFSFTVATELEAFQAAYVYQGMKRVNVKPTPEQGYLVQVYK